MSIIGSPEAAREESEVTKTLEDRKSNHTK
jgi:hypothetical protein